MSKYGTINKKYKKMWLKALRSGEYLQGEGCLVHKDDDGNDRFCCLGVLANELVKEGGVGWQSDGMPLHVGSGSLGNHVMHLVGLSPEAEDRLIEMNDDQNKGFVAIANWIEKTLEEV